jgi:transposase
LLIYTIDTKPPSIILKYILVFDFNYINLQEKMKRLKTVCHLDDKALLNQLNKQTSPRAFRDWQIIYSVQTNYGKKAEEIAETLGVSKHRIYSIIQRYNKHGLAWRTYDNWGGRREVRCLMTIEQEAQILKSVERQSLSGNILIYKHLKVIIEKKLGKSVSDDYIWDLFKRHGWRKKMPRQSHPKSDKATQEEYKKNSKSYWQPKR